MLELMRAALELAAAVTLVASQTAEQAPASKIPSELGIDGELHPACLIIAETDDEEAHMECGDGYIEFPVPEETFEWTDPDGERHKFCFNVRKSTMCSDGYGFGY